ncbi:RHS repeat-associated core domain-containing protein [Paenibacillus phocaensis]|uniref:RHS repeat-associated core domain-containing protein n=1 Tax=Paenibacillus phocaensis TaxID=1776378 RepID=UPI0003A7FAC8|nr:RHS repeat-associated core domain-containing protein [Paenibacillus phocaensis]
MKGITVSIDRIVIDFTGVHWNFFNEFHKRICHFYGVGMAVEERGFQYRIRINTGEHFLHISYKLIYAPRTQKNTLRIEAYPKSLVYFRHWLEQIRDYAKQALFVRCDVAYDIPAPIQDVFTMSKTSRKWHSLLQWEAYLFGYTGLGYDAASGLSYARARYFNPSLGRFVSQDTYEGEITNPQSLNLYTYVENNPLIYTDPSGKYKSVLDVESLLNDAMQYTSPNSNLYWLYRSKLGSIFQPVYNEEDNNQFKFLYGKLTQTSAYGNSEKQAYWAKGELLKNYSEWRKDQGTINGIIALITGGIGRGPKKTVGVKKPVKGTGNGASSSIKSVDDILEGASPGRATKGKATQYGKSGGYNQALDDFNSMGVTEVKDIPGGKVGKLPDGRTVNVREKSSDGRPTLEIYDGKKSTKIRYDD